MTCGVSTRGSASIATAGAAMVLMLGGCSSGPSRPASASLTADCSTNVQAGKPLEKPPPNVPVAGHPTAFVGAPDGKWAFASVSTFAGQDETGASGAVEVLNLGGAKPRLVRKVSLPRSLAGAWGMALTHNGQLLLVAGYTATAVLSVRALENGGHSPLTGVLTDAGAGQFEVAVSGDDRYAFVTDETTGGLSVFDLAAALQHGFSAAGVAVGIVPLAPGAVGVAISPGGRQLYVTTYSTAGPHGRLWVIDAARAENGAGSTAVLAHAAAGCQPVRVAVSPDSRTVWVTASQSNALLEFSASELLRDPSRALQAVVRVGSEPVGLLLADGGRIALVANSNRGLVQGTGSDVPQTVSVIKTASALGKRPALIGAVPAGLFPRDLTFDPATGEVLLANFSSDTVEEFRVPAPSAP